MLRECYFPEEKLCFVLKRTKSCSKYRERGGGLHHVYKNHMLGAVTSLFFDGS